MATVPTANAEVISLFRRHSRRVSSPYDDDPPPMIIMYTIGARSGNEHLVPLRAVPAGDDLIVFGSAHGKPTHPDWSSNMKAPPDFIVEIGSETRRVHAVEVTGEERDRLVAAHKARHPVFADFEQRLERTIPVMRLKTSPGA